MSLLNDAIQFREIVRLCCSQQIQLTIIHFSFLCVCVPIVKCRVRENLLNTLTRKFIDEMKAYQAAQQKYKTDIQNKMKRQVKVVKPDATDEEVDEIMRSEGGRDALYKQTILAGGVNDEIT